MSILKRIKRLAMGNISHLLDRVDTPEQELSDTITELESTAAEAKEALAGFAATHKRMEKEMEKLSSLRDEWQEKAEACLKANDEAMAKRSLGERMKIDERIKLLEPRLTKSDGMFQELKANLISLYDQLKSAKVKLAELESRKRAALAEKQFSEKMGKIAASSSTEEIFEKFEDEVFKVESESEIDRHLRDELTSLDTRVEKLSTESKIDSELEALKKKMSD